MADWHLFKSTQSSDDKNAEVTFVQKSVLRRGIPIRDPGGGDLKVFWWSGSGSGIRKKIICGSRISDPGSLSHAIFGFDSVFWSQNIRFNDFK
jgi:hypothetical protein